MELGTFSMAAGNPASVPDENEAAHNAQRQEAQQNVGGQAPPIATQPKENGFANGHTENNRENEGKDGLANGHTENSRENEREGSTGSQEGIQLSAIKIITKHIESEEEEEDDSDEESEPEEEVKPKKMVKKKKKKAPAKPAEVLTTTLSKALRMINEQKEKERRKIKQAEIRKMALEQKRRQEIAGPPRVLIHI